MTSHMMLTGTQKRGATPAQKTLTLR